MFYAYVKQAKVGELAEGENPFHTIRIGAEDELLLAEKRAQYLENGWENAEESEWEGTDESVVEEVIATEEAIGKEVVEEVSPAEEPAKEAE